MFHLNTIVVYTNKPFFCVLSVIALQLPNKLSTKLHDFKATLSFNFLKSDKMN